MGKIVGFNWSSRLNEERKNSIKTCKTLTYSIVKLWDQDWRQKIQD